MVMSAAGSANANWSTKPEDSLEFDLYVRGTIPAACEGALLIATSRRHKDRHLFSRWHDSQADLIRLDVQPGHPGRIRARVLPIDASARDLSPHFVPNGYEAQAYGVDPAYGYATQPNHAVNVSGGTIWATNLLFGAPIEVDLASWRATRLLRFVEPDEQAPRISTSAHFAWSLDKRYAYFHQSRLRRETPDSIVTTDQLVLVRLDTRSGASRVWQLLAPKNDARMDSANFHSAFYFEEDGRRFVGLLRTGAVIERLASVSGPRGHSVVASPVSEIWIVELSDASDVLQATLLPGIRELGGIAISHLDVDASGSNGFTLFANFKQADVAEETYGVNVYGEDQQNVAELYQGMIVEAFNCGLVLRYEHRGGVDRIRSFRRPYDPGHTTLGHTWLPINIELDAERRWLFCTFNGLRPRLLPQHIVDAYPGKTVDPRTVRYIPPLLMRFDAATLVPDVSTGRGHLSYAEPMPTAVMGSGSETYVGTFSPEAGLRLYRADDLTWMVAHAVSAKLEHWGDSYFRPEPAHMDFVPV